MLHSVHSLSPAERAVLERLVGRQLAEDESLNITPTRVYHEAPVGEERVSASKEYLASLDRIAVHADTIPADEFEALVSEACEHVRHS